jgi:hypothetical protein
MPTAIAHITLNAVANNCQLRGVVIYYFIMGTVTQYKLFYAAGNSGQVQLSSLREE